MANVKNYGLRGVGSDVQMGKAGGRLVYDSGNTLFKFTESDGSTLAKIQVADPTGATDAVSKGYLDGVTQGLDIKASVRAASTGNVNLSTDVQNGSTLDGVTLATGDRILLKDQSTGSENGIYVVAASGAPARASDFDDSDSVSGGGFAFVEEGTANADNGYVVTNDGAITVGSTAITFSQFSGAGQITAGAAMTKSGNTLDVAVDDSSIEVSSDALQVKALGITNAMLAGSIDLTSKVTGTLPVANGGTGAATHTSGGVLIGAGAGAVTSNKAAPTGDFVGSSDTQTLTNKTLTSPNISGGTINGNPTIATNDATLTGGSIAGMDVTIGAGKTLDVDGTVDIDASSGNMDGVIIGATTPAAGTFSTAETTGLATLATVDINGGAIDNAVIGGTTPASITGTNVRANTKVVAETFEAFSDGNDITFSDPVVFSEGMSITSGQSFATDTISEKTGAAGVTIDGVLLKDNGITASGAVDFSGATLTLDNDSISGDKIEGGTIGSVSITSGTIGTADINGGAIDGTVIGGATKAAGGFTDLTATGAFTSQGIDDNATSTQVTITDTAVTLGGDLAVTGDISADNMTLSGNITISGDTVQADVTTLTVEDAIIEVGRNNTNGSETHLGIKAERGSAGDDAFFVWDEANDRWIAATSADGSTFTLANMAFGGLSLNNVTGNLIGDVKSTNGTVILDSGTDGTDAEYTGSVTGDVTGDVTGNITSTGTSTFSTIDVNGGAIDGAAIGANSASTGAFTTLGASGAITGASTLSAAGITDSTLTAGRILYAGTGGALSDKAVFTFNDSTDTLGVTGKLSVDNIDIDGNAISSSNANGDISLNPNGDGKVDVNNSVIAQVSAPTNGGDAANKTYVDSTIAATTALTITDGSTNQAITMGDTFTIAGTANEVDVAVSATDTLTIGLPNDVTIGNDLTVTGDVGGATATITGTVTAGAFNDGAATYDAGTITGGVAATFSGAVQGGSLTDGTMTISSGDIAAARDVSMTRDLTVGGNATVTGNLTVNGTLTSISTTNTTIKDNVIVLNEGESGNSITAGTAGIEVDRGSSDNASFVYDDATDQWKAMLGTNTADMAVNDLSVSTLSLSNDLGLAHGGTGTDTSGFSADSLMKMTGGGAVSELAKGSNSTVLKVDGSGTLAYAKVDMANDTTGALPLAQGGTGQSSVGSAAQILRVNSGANGTEWAYNTQLYNSNGDLILDTSGATTSTNKLVVTNAADEAIISAASANGIGNIDLRLKAQASGNVIIDGSGAGYVGGDDDEDLNVRGGASNSGDAGDLVLRGGFGATTNNSGNVVIAGGTGGAADGKVKFQDSNLADVLVIDGVGSAANYAELKNSAAGDGVALNTLGSDTDVNLLITPKGDGVINVPASYKDRSEFGTNSLATKEYVDATAATATGAIQIFRSALTPATANLGTVNNVAGKAYYIEKVVINVTVAFDASADHFIISDGSNDFTVAADTDASATGTYVIDLPYATATAGGSTVSVTVKDASNNTITYNAGTASVAAHVVAV